MASISTVKASETTLRAIACATSEVFSVQLQCMWHWLTMHTSESLAFVDMACQEQIHVVQSLLGFYVTIYETLKIDANTSPTPHLKFSAPNFHAYGTACTRIRKIDVHVGMPRNG